MLSGHSRASQREVITENLVEEMKTRFLVSFSAFVAKSRLKNWYLESLDDGRMSA
jgi:hypothetical protein